MRFPCIKGTSICAIFIDPAKVRLVTLTNTAGGSPLGMLWLFHGPYGPYALRFY